MAGQYTGMAFAGLLAGTGLVASLTATAQTNPPPVPANAAPASLLFAAPSATLSNGLVTAKVYLPGPNGFYRGTRFDHAGLVLGLTYKGQNYGPLWFSKTSPEVRDFVYDGDDVITGINSSIAGPVEEFDQIGFDEAGPGGSFLKIGVGILKRDADIYDRFHVYPVVTAGTRSTLTSKTSVQSMQSVADAASGYGYDYVKTVRLAPGKAQMVIEHRLKNTGRKRIVASVFDHNFLSLSAGNADIEIAAPFKLGVENPFSPELTQVDGNTIRYVRALTGKERYAATLTGYGPSAGDYDFRITNTKTGFGQRMRADQPLARLMLWSIRTTVSLEPYVAINLAPGQEKRWTYTYDYFAPGDAKP